MVERLWVDRLLTDGQLVEGHNIEVALHQVYTFNYLNSAKASECHDDTFL